MSPPKPHQLLLLLALASSPVAQAAATGPDGHLARNLAATCANCHGSNGHAVPKSGISTLAGTPADRLLQRLNEYRNGSRAATIMHQIAKGYSDQQLQLIADYFAAQTVPASTGTAGGRP